MPPNLPPAITRNHTPTHRRLTQAVARVQAGNYSLTPLVGMELRGKTVGVLGTGEIGGEAARIFKVGCCR